MYRCSFLLGVPENRSGGKAEWLVMGAKLKLLGLPAKGVRRWGEEGVRKRVDRNCPRLWE